MGRDDAYRVVQRLAQRALDELMPLRELLAADPAGAGLDVDRIFDYAPFVRYADEIVGRLDQIVTDGGEDQAHLRAARAR
jgi:adenylosuccinate lyase